ncbi:RPO41 [Sanghuangporus weigelae]
MIPLSRRSTSRKLGTALLSCSRQALPRPARLYSTPSKPVHTPALATVTKPPSEDYAVHMNTRQAAAGSSNGSTLSEGIHDFLDRKLPYTILPAPVPTDTSSPLNEIVFPGSPVQESLTIIDACLHGCYDVPRAQYIFDQLRGTSRGAAVMQPRIFNLFLEVYLEMALDRDFDSRDEWMEKAWQLYAGMENQWEAVAPNAGTYAIMLKTWLRRSTMKFPPDVPSERSPDDLLLAMLDRKISPVQVVADRLLSSADSADIIQHLCRAAAKMNMHNVISDLGQAQEIADPLADVPEVMPVKVVKHIDLPLAKDIPQETLDALAQSAETRDVTEETPFNIANLRKHLAEVAYAQRVLPDDMAARQKLLEASVYDLAVERLRHESLKLDEVGVGKEQKLLSAQLQKWMFDWHEKLTRRLAAEIAEVVSEEAHVAPSKRDTLHCARLGPFLSLLKPSKLSLITILELMRLQGTGGVTEGMKTARALLTVGKAVEMEYKAEVLKKNNIQIPTVSGRPMESGFFTKRAYQDLREWRKSAVDFWEGNQEWTAEWTHAVRARVGSFLVDCLMDVAMVTRTAIDPRTGEEITEDQPAFYHSYEYLRGQKLGVIRLNPVVAERLQKDDIRATLHPRHLPMLIKPKAWISHDEGGYIYNKNSVMRIKDTQEQLTYLRFASAAGHMEHVYAGLDVLSSTPWIINRDVFDIVLQVWNSGEKFVKIPEAVYSEPEPTKPDDYDTNAESKVKYLLAWKRWHTIKANCHSHRCSVNYKVEIARAFLADKFYFPHNVDFRGRAYPIPPHLNHIGDDLSRGLLKFAEKKPLGASGLRWLRIHLANLFGFDKGSFEERLQFVQDHMADIYDSAEKPLEGNRWWTKADDPWQCLAACKELHNALESGDPEAYETNLPVHQDGTCNGLQHYAALGGDAMGARQVNLDIADRPADVYSHVADMVDQMIQEDMNNGHKHARMLHGKISRKVVKQTVMTTVYGVTFIGAREQIAKQLKDRGDVEAHEIWSCSSYLAKVVMASIGDLFSGAKAIQNWLTISARLIAKSMPRERIETAIEECNEKLNMQMKKAGKKNVLEGRLPQALPLSRLPKEQMTSVVWTTPLGLPIVQPYRKTKRKQVMTSIQTVFISDPNAPSEVNATKQATAFPPNFIHSLDATHMMLTALECNKAGLTFASVHDSYWTHAGSISRMNEIIRDTFIALHSSNVLQKLREEFIDRYKDYQIPLHSLKTASIQKQMQKTQAELMELGVRGGEKRPEESTSAENAEELLAQVQAEVIDAADAEETSNEELDESLDATIGAEASLPDAPEDMSVDLNNIPGEMAALIAKAKEKGIVVHEGDERPRRRHRSKEVIAAEKLAKEKRKGVREREYMQHRMSVNGVQETFVTRFVNVTDVIPPLPKKGEFDVNKIKDSLYFFS